MDKRKRNLLIKMAADLSEGRGLLSHDFLVENDISLDECMSLASTAAAAIHALAGAPEWIQTAAVGVWAARDVIPPEYGWSIAEQKEVERKLAEFQP